MERLNYNHLFYFYTVAKQGTISAAAEQLMVAQPTISEQIRTLESTLGAKLFRRSGRYLVLTDTGRLVFRYADEIFPLGHELLARLAGQPTGSPLRFRVGIADVVPKIVAHAIIKPVLKSKDAFRLICHEGTQVDLLARVAIHDLDLVVSDSPVNPAIQVRLFSHLLGECAVSIFGTKKHVDSYRRRFPMSLNGAPFLLPSSTTALRQSLEKWFSAEQVRPVIVAEFDDSALLKVFGQGGLGLFAAPSVAEKEIKRQYGVRVIGRLPSVRERYYAITAERKLKHPAVSLIANTARDQLFD